MKSRIFKQGFLIAVLTLLQAVLAPVIVVAVLYVVTVAITGEFAKAYVVVASLAATLSALLLNVGQTTDSPFNFDRLSIAVRVLFGWMMVIAVLLFIGFLSNYSSIYVRRIFLPWIVLTPILLIVARLAIYEVLHRILFSPANSRLVVFAGCNEISKTLAAGFDKDPKLCMRVEGFFDDRSSERLGADSDERLKGPLSEITKFVKARGIDILFISLPLRHVKRVMNLLDDIQDTTVSIYYVPDVFVFDLIQSRSDEIMGVPVVAMCETPFYGFRGVTKRCIDVIISAMALLIASPLLLTIGLLVKFSSRGPVLFKQRRYGLDGREIRVYKFRTMNVVEDGETVSHATRSDPRVTSVGRVLRRYSLDEIPQLINVLQGQMSLVGPRPHAVAHNEQYRKLIKGYMVRHKVLPGITGLAQVNGCRGEISELKDMKERIEYDLEYLRKWSPLLDIQIIYRTLTQVFWDRKAY